MNTPRLGHTAMYASLNHQTSSSLALKAHRAGNSGYANFAYQA
jgi:hypothetical protein